MNPTARNAYLASSVTTASPARLLVMLLERLVLDIERGLEAQQSGDHQAAHNQLIHAQDIVVELSTSLRPDVWDGAANMAALYDFLGRQLTQANIRRDPATTASSLELARQICDTWREAALVAAAPAGVVAAG
ncbi:flagellar export chaperone FliS [Nocardioides sp. AE5]|uniref:flagellar export chaperone FliS n=1 Tax=Nocardioides sp. AE5 TaxID=2962573 RepID=UPI002880DF2A|nr:flagellar export chaperone FliS [Nocardioides sp. AE5]MDT0200814.1 flagellar export chaperone FliS [Nocardioides sp. AE5]